MLGHEVVLGLGNLYVYKRQEIQNEQKICIAVWWEILMDMQDVIGYDVQNFATLSYLLC